MAKKDMEETASGPSWQGSMNAFLDQGSAFDGKLTFQGVVRIDGRFTGDILAEDTLLVGTSGTIKGTAKVGSADIGGKIEGNLTVLDTVHFRESAQFDGELTAARLIVDDGAKINGTISMVLDNREEEVQKIKSEVEQTLF